MSGISRWPRFWARYGPDRPVLVHQEQTVTWGELEERCAQVAAGLYSLGVRKGDRVAGLMRNGPEHFEVVLACARIGAIFVPLNPLLTAPELRRLAEDALPAALVTDTFFSAVLDPLEEIVGSDRIFFTDAPPQGGRSLASLRTQGSLREDLDVLPDDPLFICYTSGTTGKAKGAVLTHANVDGLATSVISFDSLGRNDRALVTVPLAFTGAGVSFAMPMLHCGGSLIIRGEFDPGRALDDIENNGVSFMGVVPLVLQRMAAQPGFEDRDLSGLRVAKSGGAAIPQSLLRLYHERGVGLVNAYGLTEGTGCNLQLPAHDALTRVGSIGIPMLGQSAKVVGADGQEAAPGDPGELLLSGSCVMQGYWGQEEITAQTIREGWLHTGDVACVDEDGYFRIVDRAKDTIISGGINVYPAEIESVLHGHPDIEEIAVIGVPDEVWGETPVACVVTRNPDLTLEDLVAYAAGSLAAFKRPRKLVLMEKELPRGMSGKILKREIRSDLLADGAPAEARR
jgi:fatty-acyl-CoA synthase